MSGNVLALTVEEGIMGKVIAQIELSNPIDEDLVQHGKLSPDQVRKIKLDALVDTGATMLSIPEDQIKALGVRPIRSATSRYADGRREQRWIYGPVMIRCMGRVEAISVLAGHIGQPALLGQIPLEGLDLWVDTRGQRLVPNPESPDMPMVEVY